MIQQPYLDLDPTKVAANGHSLKEFKYPTSAVLPAETSLEVAQSG